PLSRGLPQKDSFDTVLRDSLATDREDPAGVYFGTRNGWLYASRDEGETWSALEENLPQITCVRAVTVSGRARARRPRPRTAPLRSGRRRKAA
ncbi:MAG: hypothetical protein ABI610_08665, partial [Acidobacteriota bacterium]